MDWLTFISSLVSSLAWPATVIVAFFLLKNNLGSLFPFIEEVYTAIARVIEYPDAWSVMSKNTRRCLINRFPCGLIYQVKNNALRIIAVANLHRRPGYWVGRVEENNQRESGQE